MKTLFSAKRRKNWKMKKMRPKHFTLRLAPLRSFLRVSNKKTNLIKARVFQRCCSFDLVSIVTSAELVWNKYFLDGETKHMWGCLINTPVLNNFSPIYYWRPIFWVGYRQTMYFLKKYMMLVRKVNLVFLSDVQFTVWFSMILSER